MDTHFRGDYITMGELCKILDKPFLDACHKQMARQSQNDIKASVVASATENLPNQPNTVLSPKFGGGNTVHFDQKNLDDTINDRAEMSQTLPPRK